MKPGVSTSLRLPVAFLIWRFFTNDQDQALLCPRVGGPMTRAALLFSLLAAICITAGFATAQQAPKKGATTEALQARSLSERLVGAWRLISVETKRSNGEVIYPFYGKHPEGLLIYDRSGWMSVQIVSDPKPDLPNIDSRAAILAATPE